MSIRMSRSERSTHLFDVVTSQSFLTKRSLGNEVPFFICPFDPSDGFATDEDRKALVTRIEHAGTKVLDLSLYDLTLEILEERGLLEKVLRIESQTEKSELKELLQAVLDPQDHLIPKIAATISSMPHDVIFLSGVGEVYPYLRSHSVLNNLQSTAKDAPTVLFFPGSYTGTSLNLFGLLGDRYYRAFNILNYEV